MPAEIHVVHHQCPPGSKRSDGPIQSDRISARRISEDEIECPEGRQKRSAVSQLEANVGRPVRLTRLRLKGLVDVDGDELDIDALAEPVDQPGQARTCSRAELQDSAVGGNGGGQARQKRTYIGFTGQAESSDDGPVSGPDHDGRESHVVDHDGPVNRRWGARKRGVTRNGRWSRHGEG